MTTASTDGSAQPHRQLDVRTRRRLAARTVAVSLAIVVTCLVAYYLAPLGGGAATSVTARLTCSIALISIAIVVAARFVRAATYPMLTVVSALAGVIALALTAFASVYVVMSADDPNAFTEPLDHTDGLYFALVTATTLGYGDISPTSQAARIVVMFQIAADVVLIGVGTRALLHLARGRSGAPGS